jgi:hypothetical protein
MIATRSDLFEYRLRTSCFGSPWRPYSNLIDASYGVTATCPRCGRNFFPRSVEQREVVRGTTFVADPMSLHEACLDLALLGHDFYLFAEIETGPRVD